MKVERASLVPYRVPLTRPIAGLHERRGLFLVLETQGARGLGEVAPWPGLHATSPDEAERRLRALLPAIEGAPLIAPGAPPRFPAWLEAEPPEIAWGLAAALLELSAAIAGLPLARLLSPDAPLHARTAALVLDRDDLDTLGDALSRFPAAKVKARAHADFPLLEAVRARLGEGELRVDGNRALPLADALALARECAPLDVAFFEEPAPADAIVPLLDAGVPIALDERLSATHPAAPLPDASVLSRAAALVLKPSVLGPARAFALLQARGRKILSSPYETAIGRSTLAHLQAAFAPGIAAGLGTGRFLERDVASLEDARGGIDLSRPLALDPDSLRHPQE